jgi:folate-dependent tRNA-U54 methylase TrmFO/GidA
MLMTTFNSVKVFSATTANDREDLGGRVTRWMKEHPTCEIVDKVVTQSSDEAYHCITITVFYRDPGA